jgi:hypothetical protein
MLSPIASANGHVPHRLISTLAQQSVVMAASDPEQPVNWRRSPAQTGPSERVRIGRPALGGALIHDV